MSSGGRTTRQSNALTVALEKNTNKIKLTVTSFTLVSGHHMLLKLRQDAG